ncbi:disease resistance protein TAO1-like [Ipomoea triloba]|nr:disease resistance protein TAO1-like [Ipomoea triloba]
MMPNLKNLNLSMCEKLKEIHLSLGNLSKLDTLVLEGCCNLEKLPRFYKEMKDITHLDLTSCSSLLETPNFAMMPNLKNLNISMCEKLKEIHPSIDYLTKLEDFYFDGCSNLRSFPSLAR